MLLVNPNCWKFDSRSVHAGKCRSRTESLWMRVSPPFSHNHTDSFLLDRPQCRHRALRLSRTCSFFFLGGNLSHTHWSGKGGVHTLFQIGHLVFHAQCWLKMRVSPLFICDFTDSRLFNTPTCHHAAVPWFYFHPVSKDGRALPSRSCAVQTHTQWIEERSSSCLKRA